ncbi:hypothetical protein [Natrarchaeobius chitinivorans]|uniref:Cytochrome-ba3 oxidase subunit n=1 Tax=Natrarchaeobius chitinivorans TaxID=1679083 RepID=A0A3N6MID7_NATCH|nr:hypothetical protein [Natrarchaeobius chitinivorans]RQG93806.1 hypothetical protein EA473_13875 [Natrarchaeobius chitinivorans]
MVSRENQILGGFILIAAVVFLLLTGFTELSSVAIIGIVLVIGVIVPQLLFQLTDVGSDR